MTKTVSRQKARAVEADDAAVNRVLARLREDIVTGRLGAAQPLRFRALTETYGTSVSSLREALARLAGEKLVLFTPNSGYRVVAATMEDLLDIGCARIEVEVSALRLSIEKGDDDWEARVVAAHHKLIRAEERSARDETTVENRDWSVRHRDFHMALVSGCGSQWLMDCCEALRIQFDRYRSLIRVPTDAYPVLIAQHTPLCDAAIARRTAEACDILRDHIRLSLDIVMERNVVRLAAAPGDATSTRTEGAEPDGGSIALRRRRSDR